MTLTPLDRQAAVDAVPVWWHSIDVGDGITTPGHKTAAMHAAELSAFRLPADLRGQRVLDIGAYDGFYSFEAERRGAEVVALDYYTWSIDFTLVEPDTRWEDSPGWQPDRLPGKRGFDTAHRLLNSRVQAIVGDFLTIDLDRLGRFDWVIFSGVLYHLPDPFQALSRLRRLTAGTAVIETAAIAIPGLSHVGLWQSYDRRGAYGDLTNWWVPTERGLVALADRAGFSRVEITQRGPARLRRERLRDLWRHVVRESTTARGAGAAAAAPPPVYRLIARCS